MKILSIGDQAKPGTYRLHSRFRHAINFTDIEGRRLVALVTPDIGAGPLNIVVDTPRFTAPRPATPHTPSGLLRVNRYSVVFAKRRYSLLNAHSYTSLLPVHEGMSPEIFRKKVRGIERLLAEESHPKSLAFLLDPTRTRHFTTSFELALVSHFQNCAPKMLSPADAQQLAGCGFGLTPSGDDFIAGILLGLNTLHALGLGSRRTRLASKLRSAATGRNPLSNAFLEMACRGRASGGMQNLVTALVYDNDAGIRRAARKVMQVGETSGADFLVGFVMTLERLLK